MTSLASGFAAAEKVSYVPATGTFSAIWLLLAFPAAGAAILLLTGERSKSWGPYLATALTGSSFLYGLVAFFALRSQDEGARQISITCSAGSPSGASRSRPGCCTTR